MKIAILYFFTLLSTVIFAQNKYEKARELFDGYFNNSNKVGIEEIEQEIISLAPNSEFAMYIRASWLAEDSLCKEALFLTDSLVSHFPDFMPGYFAQGSILNNCKSDFENAKYYFSKCIELNPDFAGSYRNLGITYFNLDLFEQADSLFRKCLAIDANDTVCMQYYGINLFLIDNVGKAYEVLKKIKEETVYISDYYYYLGWCEMELELYPDALMSFSLGIEAEPEDAEMLTGRGWAQMYLGNDKSALYDFNQALVLDSTSAEAHLGIGLVYYYMKSYSRSVIELDKAIALDKENSEPWFYKGSAFYEQKMYKEAVAAFTKSIELDLEDAYSYFFRGVSSNLWKGEEMYQSIFEDFEMAVKLKNADAESYYQLALIAFNQYSVYEISIKAVTIAIEIDPDDSRFYFLRGLIYELDGNTELACREWKKASEMGDKKAAKELKRICQ